MTLDELLLLCSELRFVPRPPGESLPAGARVRKCRSEGPDLHPNGTQGTIVRHVCTQGLVIGYWVNWHAGDPRAPSTFVIVPKVEAST